MKNPEAGPQRWIVTIDGPAGTGKSTVARELARRLQIEFLDTGAMYRAVAWRALQQDLSLEDGAGLAGLTVRLQFQLRSHQLLVDGIDPGAELRTPEVTRLSSQIAAQPEVRSLLVEQQQRIAQGQSLVTEGRDQGTVVFPRATCKFFLTARPEVRATRRYFERAAHPDAPTLEQILQDQQERDERDASRAVGPLRPADDALVVDTSDLSLEQVLDLLEQEVRSRISKR